MNHSDDDRRFHFQTISKGHFIRWYFPDRIYPERCDTIYITSNEGALSTTDAVTTAEET